MPKLAHAVTARELKTMTKPGLTPLGGVSGLYLIVDKLGHRSFVFRYTVKGTGARKKMGLGSLSVVTLKEARERAAELRRMVEDGGDPIADKQQAIREKREAEEAAERKRKLSLHTVSYCAKAFLEERSKAGYWKDNVRGESVAVSYMKRNIIPVIGDIPIDKLTPHDVFRVIGPTWQTQIGAAPATLSIIYHTFRWAKAKGWCTGDNPADRKGALGVLLEPFDRGKRKGENYPALDFNEIPRFIAECLLKGDVSYSLVALSIILVLRSKMIRCARWQDVNFKDRTMTIPESSFKTKGRGNHVVFLSEAAVSILKNLPRYDDTDLLFPCTRKHYKPLSDNAPSYVFRTMHALRFERDKIGWVDPVQTKEKGVPVIATQHGTARAGFKTWSKTGENRKRFDEDACELCMAHKLKDDYGGAYNRATLEPERRFVMEEWGKFCLSEYKRAKDLMPWLK